jgi:hypothetical protein
MKGARLDRRNAVPLAEADFTVLKQASLEVADDPLGTAASTWGLGSRSVVSGDAAAACGEFECCSGRGRDISRLIPPRTDPHERHYRMGLLSWMIGVKASSGVRMEHARLRKPAVHQPHHSRPAQVMLLATTSQDLPP